MVEVKVDITNEKLPTKCTYLMKHGYNSSIDTSEDFNGEVMRYFKETILIFIWKIEIGRIEII